jgi:hypothetical protein
MRRCEIEMGGGAFSAPSSERSGDKSGARPQECLRLAERVCLQDQRLRLV